MIVQSIFLIFCLFTFCGCLFTSVQKNALKINFWHPSMVSLKPQYKNQMQIYLQFCSRKDPKQGLMSETIEYFNFFLEPFMASWPQNIFNKFRPSFCNSETPPPVFGQIFPKKAKIRLDYLANFVIIIALLLSRPALSSLSLSLKWLLLSWLTSAVWDSTSDWLFTNLSTNQRLWDKMTFENRSTSSASSNFIRPPSKRLFGGHGFKIDQMGQDWCQIIGKWGRKNQISCQF